MNFKITFLALASVLLVSINSDAQKVKVTSGKLKALSTHKSFNMEYTYTEGLLIGKKTEKEYLEEKVSGKNAKKAGTGTDWAKAWEENKAGGKFFNKFETLFNEVLKGEGVTASRDNADATSTIKVNVYFMDPGYNVGISRKPAYVSMTVTFVVDGKDVAIVNMSKAPGSGAGGYDFDAAYRISESFEKSGKTLAKTLAKAAY